MVVVTEPGSALPSVIRRILNDDPPLPSALVPSGYPFGRREVAGDLDAIILKAMRRAPQDRYRGVGDLVDDVRSHMALRPVAARSGSAGYTIGRYLRRHRVATAAAAAALRAIVAGGGAKRFGRNFGIAVWQGGTPL